MFSPTIGSRWKQTLDRIEHLLESTLTTWDPNDQDWMERTRDRLQHYRENTYMTAKELNRITDLEATDGRGTL